MGKALTAIHHQHDEHDNSWEARAQGGSRTKGNGAARNAEDDQPSAGGSGNNDDGRVRANTLGSRGTSWNVPFEGSQIVHQGPNKHAVG